MSTAALKVQFLSATQCNPSLSPATVAGMGDLATLWDGKGTFAENLIEFAGRVCYRSTHRMGTAPEFISARVREGHEDIIEHVVVTIRITDSDEPLRWRMINRHCEVSELGNRAWLVSGNTRVWLDFFRRGIALDAVPILKAVAPAVFAEFKLSEGWAVATGEPSPVATVRPALLPVEDGAMRVTLLGYTQPVLEDAQHLLDHGSATFLFEGVSRTLTHQLVRHRLGSFSQESQRYCNYEVLSPNLEPTVPALPAAKEEKTHGLNLFSPDQERFINELYAKGFSCEKLADTYDVDPTTVRGIVLRNGGRVRNRQESRSQHIKTDFFDQIDSPIKARILGLIYADGNIAQQNGEILHGSITQHKDYADWLSRIGKLWGGNVIGGGREQSVKLSIPGKTLAAALVRHGVMPAKSLLLQPPQLADDLIRSFILGYLEGDGHIGSYPKNPLVNFTGTKELLEWIRNQICAVLGKSPEQNLVQPHGPNCYTLTFGGREQSPIVLEWLYDQSEMRYAHPAKLERAIVWSPQVATWYHQQTIDWGKKYQVIVPPKIGPKEWSIFAQIVEETAQTYANLRYLGIRKEDARFLLPNAAETRIITTMNYAAWGHFMWLRAVDKAAQWEIRKMGQYALKMLYEIAPTVFEQQWQVYQKEIAKR